MPGQSAVRCRFSPAHTVQIVDGPGCLFSVGVNSLHPRRVIQRIDFKIVETAPVGRSHRGQRTPQAETDPPVIDIQQQITGIIVGRSREQRAGRSPVVGKTVERAAAVIGHGIERLHGHRNIVGKKLIVDLLHTFPEIASGMVILAVPLEGLTLEQVVSFGQAAFGLLDGHGIVYGTQGEKFRHAV